MSNSIQNLEPKIIWNNFCKLNAVPRPSKKEERVIKFIHDFGISLGLETIIDEIPGVKKSYVYGKPNPILGNMLYVKIQLNIVQLYLYFAHKI